MELDVEAFQEVAEAISSVVFFLRDLELDKVVYVSPAYEPMFGRTVAALLADGRDFLQAIHPDDRERVRQALPDHREGRYDETYRLLGADGQVRWVRSRGFPLRGPDGQVRRIAGLVQDVTEHVTTQRALSDRVSQHAAIADLGVFALAADSTDQVCREAARCAATLVGGDYAALLVGDDTGALTTLANAGWPALDSEPIFPNAPECQAGLTRRSRVPIVVDDYADERRFAVPPAVRDVGATSGISVTATGGLVLLVLSRRSRRFSQEDIHALQSAVNIVADARTRDATHRALRESEDRFRQAQKMEAIGRLAGGVAHDFNNMLTAILGYADLMSGSVQGSPLEQQLARIREAATRAATLTRQLLLFARRQVLAPRLVDVNQCIGALQPMLRRLIGEDVDLQVALGAGLRSVMIDPGHLEQVVMNLVINARDAMPRGGTIRIESARAHLSQVPPGARGAAPRGGCARIAIRDAGIGMTADVLAHLFEPFFTTKPAGKGTGLGLSTVYGIIEGAGGCLTVDSQAGRGTTFTLYLPYAESRSATHRLPIKAARPELPRGTERLLLVEDEDLVRDLAGSVLTSLGYDVVTACDGQDGLEAFSASGPFALLISDVVMPRMSGPELARALPGLKVLFLSGYTSGAIQTVDELGGETALLQKPFTPHDLAHRVRELLDVDGPAD